MVIFFEGGFAPLHQHPQLRPWTPFAFGLKILVRTGSCSTVFKEFSASVPLHNSKNRNRKNLKLGISFIQPIAILSCKFNIKIHFFFKSVHIYITEPQSAE